ncbi:DUF5329 domain-containing protein [Undibacterium macrobrachii]|uniref:DUF5329 domain-containing protein n=1 Tax=Undibacterium macrobrachii TaxID=1119058 RepID=A0ABQ2X9S9_9BURK|nr:DUF5329 domain-containing protein [Undibacterium macrobrachii]GGX06304.1 hypothetical protein GCM10011282_10870 [Undibacterium macrobrachii]
MRLVYFLLFLVTLCPSVVSKATQTPSTTRTEIQVLLKRLQDSGCQFNRNGSWYSGAEAQTHLSKKLDYLERKNMLKSTEDFIKLGASTSSYSGKAYLVKCGNTPAVESKLWLGEQLRILRESK